MTALVIEASERWVRGRQGDATVVDTRRPLLVWEAGKPVPRYVFAESDVRTELLPADVVWRYDDPRLAGHVAVEWSAARWFEEEEEIFIHPRDPHKRVDAIPSSRHVVVEIEGVPVAETRAPVLVFETGLPIRYYIPPGDVHRDLFDPSDLRTGCPYKGTAGYLSLRAPRAENIAWYYAEPLPAVGPIRDHIAFYNEFVDHVVDGERLERPVTPFSRAH
ncbi:DUF427 domain-containing protein [Dactylosporangium vinaceum]|uniref:DUF427 domain-containing protein n=1 Tax=Dactylosporangium vinaceum TaxID=53362 RepID=A0ABV5M310_9ACTN|nr:DUF427 domain-containing protein [Dactylosporangium vinaceum]UAB99845.1 DUF427 domain-containing protein [Dactylosporangium vinaceum]